MTDTVLSPARLRLFAVAGGAAAASLWYSQPLLSDLAHGLGVGAGTAGLTVAVAQLGYVVGLLALVPRGDHVDRRRLIVGLMSLGALGAAGCAAAPSLAVLLLATLVTGIGTASAQVLLPLTGDYAEEESRGRAVGVVMSGVLIGILAARTVSGLLAGAAGWRTVYVVSAVLLAVLAVALWHALPDESDRRRRVSTWRTLGEVAELIAGDGELRRRMVLGALGLAIFNLLWSGLTLLLSAPPYRFGPAAIGLFGVAGIAGALAACRAGRRTDAGSRPAAGGGWWVVALLAWGLCAAAHAWLGILVAGLVVYDAGMQGQHVTNQTVLFARFPGRRGRVTTAYTTISFVGGAIGSVLASVAWGAAGWGGICVAGAGLSAIALAIAVWPARRQLGRRLLGSRSQKARMSASVRS